MKGEKFQKLHLGNISQCWDILTLSLTINGIDFFFFKALLVSLQVYKGQAKPGK